MKISRYIFGLTIFTAALLDWGSDNSTWEISTFVIAGMVTALAYKTLWEDQ